MNALTITRNGLNFERVPVDVQKMNARKNAQIMFWHNGEEIIVHASKLSEYVSDKIRIKILSCDGDFTIADNKIYFILEA